MLNGSDASYSTQGNDTMAQLNQLILQVSKTIPFRSNLDRHLIRAAMVYEFFAFSIQKWNHYTIEMLVPMISHSPVVFWLLPVFGLRGAGYFLATTETSSALSFSSAIGARG